MKSMILIGLAMLAAGCIQGQSQQLHQICRGSVCCMGFGNECAILKCSNDVYYLPGGSDAASLFVNSSGDIVARCGGNIMPMNAEQCPLIEKTCDMTKPAESVPEAVRNLRSGTS